MQTVTAKLTKEAAEWFAPYIAQGDTVPFATLSELQAAMTATWVGKDPYDLLNGDLYSRVLTSFESWSAFRAWFVRTAAGLREYAPAGREWTDVPLVDRFIAALNGTRYYEGVVVDPDTDVRPASLQRALHLADARHNVLLHRNQGYAKRGKGRDGDPSGGGGGGAPGGAAGGKDRSPGGGGGGKQKQLGVRPTPTKTKGMPPGKGDGGGAKKTMAETLAGYCGVDVATAERRLKAGQCVTCGGTGHRSRDCPKGATSGATKDPHGKRPATN
jgi:hypothetical protein